MKMKMTPEKKALRSLERMVARSDRMKLEEQLYRVLRRAVDDVAQLSDECPSINSYQHIAGVWRRVAKHAKRAQARADALIATLPAMEAVRKKHSTL